MTTLLIDVNNAAHRAWAVLQKTAKDKQTGVILGVLRDIRFFQEVLEADRVMFFFDGPSILNYRKGEYPGYKTNRSRVGKAPLYQQITILRETILMNLGFMNVFRQNGYEADDLIAAMALYLEDDCVIVSTDSDLWQCINRKVSIWNPITKTQITTKRFIDEWGIDPQYWWKVKAIMGDKGDNIPGIPSIAEVTAIKYLLDKPLPESLKAKIDAAAEQIAFNEKLIKLPYNGPVGPMIVLSDELSQTKWTACCAEYQLPLHTKYPIGAN